MTDPWVRYTIEVRTKDARRLLEEIDGVGRQSRASRLFAEAQERHPRAHVSFTTRELWRIERWLLALPR